MGAIMCVVLAKLFMNAYPVLRLDQYSGAVEGADKWQSAMTYKFVGALQGLTHPSPFFGKALAIGIGIGLATEVGRKVLKSSAAYKRFLTQSSAARPRTSASMLSCSRAPTPRASAASSTSRRHFGSPWAA